LARHWRLARLLCFLLPTKVPKIRTVFILVIWLFGRTLATATAAATAEAAHEVAASEKSTEAEQSLEPLGLDTEQGAHQVFSNLVCKIKTKAAIFVVQLSFLLITQDSIGTVDLLEHLLSLRIVRIFVRVIPAVGESLQDSVPDKSYHTSVQVCDTSS
jgi:hypothetical protein